MELTTRTIQPCDRVCLRLKQAREDAGVSFDAMADALRISKDHLLHLESCKYDQLPFGRLYQKKLLTKYLSKLEIDPTPYLQQFHLEEGRDEDDTPTHRGRSYVNLPNLPLLLRVAGVSTIVLGVLAYLLLQVQQIVEPPALMVFGPDDGHLSRSGMVTVQGKTETGAQILINGTAIANDESGFFTQEVPLAEGVNTIILSAKKRHGREISQTRHVIYKIDEGLTASESIGGSAF